MNRRIRVYRKKFAFKYNKRKKQTCIVQFYANYLHNYGRFVSNANCIKRILWTLEYRNAIFYNKTQNDGLDKNDSVKINCHGMNTQHWNNISSIRLIRDNLKTKAIYLCVNQLRLKWIHIL